MEMFRHKVFCTGLLLVIIKAINGNECVKTCQDMDDGDYQSCQGCNVYVTCSNKIMYDNRPCPGNLKWDDNKKRCEFTSDTCDIISTPGCISDCSNVPNGDYQSCYRCDVYVTCSYGRTLDFRPCPGNLVWDDNSKRCEYYSDTCRPMSIEEQCSLYGGIIPHPTECQAYYDCSHKYDRIPPFFEQCLKECLYSQLFDSASKECKPFEEVYCGKRKEFKDGYKQLSLCETFPKFSNVLQSKTLVSLYTYNSISLTRGPFYYENIDRSYRRNQCPRASCIPCYVYLPSCVGKPDGNAVHEYKRWSPSYAVCYKERTVSVETCDADQDGRPQLFHPERLLCVPLEEIPRQHGGLMPNCTQKPDGNYLDEFGRCNRYTVCRFGQFVEVGRCIGGEVFDQLTAECMPAEDVCRPCGNRVNC